LVEDDTKRTCSVTGRNVHAVKVMDVEPELAL
jgi:hypothetical protein